MIISIEGAFCCKLHLRHLLAFKYQPSLVVNLKLKKKDNMARHHIRYEFDAPIDRNKFIFDLNQHFDARVPGVIRTNFWLVANQPNEMLLFVPQGKSKTPQGFTMDWRPGVRHASNKINKILQDAHDPIPNGVLIQRRRYDETKVGQILGKCVYEPGMRNRTIPKFVAHCRNAGLNVDQIVDLASDWYGQNGPSKTKLSQHLKEVRRCAEKMPDRKMNGHKTKLVAMFNAWDNANPGHRHSTRLSKLIELNQELNDGKIDAEHGHLSHIHMSQILMISKSYVNSLIHRLCGYGKSIFIRYKGKIGVGPTGFANVYGFIKDVYAKWRKPKLNVQEDLRTLITKEENKNGNSDVCVHIASETMRLLSCFDGSSAFLDPGST